MPVRRACLLYFNSFTIKKYFHQEDTATHPSTALKLWYMKRPMAHLRLQIGTSERKIGEKGVHEVYPLRQRNIWAILVGII